ncbi:MAG: rhomboid family intramembrane serine protease [Methanomassiliicoccaceae archaeon]|nr:rhomboid family intramembrane serine protease [Methanomassiliicoccaceae archaeon]
METVSWMALGIIAASLILLAWRRYSPTMILVMACFGVYFVTMFDRVDHFIVMSELGYVSPLFFDGENMWTIVTSMFVHADLVHLAFNMIFLILIGFPLEMRIGKGRFVIVYLIGGVIGTLTMAALEWSMGWGVWLVGASGAISALFGAMIMLYPKEKILFPVVFILTNRFPVWVPIVIWFGTQIAFFVFDSASPVAYAAHLGGFAAGAGVAWIIRPRDQIMNDDTSSYNVSMLRPLCVTPSLKEAYHYMETARDVETMMIWAEKIIDDARCPLCGSRIIIKEKGFGCENGHDLPNDTGVIAPGEQKEDGGQ